MVAVLRYWILLLLGTTCLGHAELSTRLSSDSIEELESVRLVIRDHGAQQTETLDLTELQNNFHIMGNNTSKQYQYINGRTQSWVDYQITLQPKRTGDLAIPPINIGTKSTSPLTVRVVPLAPATRQKIDELVFYEQTFSTLDAYVQSQILMQRQLFYSNGVQLYGGQPTAPKIDDAVVITLGENRASTVQRDGKLYGVVTQNYAIFPESSGTLTVPSVEMTASVRVLNNNRVSRKGVRVSTEPQAINVRPVPNNYPPNEPWLPATDVTITQGFEPDVTQGSIKVGDTFTQTIQVTATSNTGSIVPPLTFSVPREQFRQYPDPPELRDDTLGNEVIGRRIERRNFIALQPGALSLPSSEVVWWDTQSNRLRSATLPATPISVTGTAITSQSNEASQATAPEQSSTTPQSPPSNSITENQNLAADLSTGRITPGLLGKLGLGLIVTVVVWLSWRYAQRPNQIRQRALERCRKELLKQIQNQNFDNIQPLVSGYLKLRYGLTHNKAREAWINDQPEAATFLHLLDQSSYDQKTKTPDEDRILQLATNLLNTKPAKAQKEKRRALLPALYPQTR